MVGFSCFYSSSFSHKPKKNPNGSVNESSQDFLWFRTFKSPSKAKALIPKNENPSEDGCDSTPREDREWKSDELNATSESFHEEVLKKSRSLGSILCNSDHVTSNVDKIEAKQEISDEEQRTKEKSEETANNESVFSFGDQPYSYKASPDSDKASPESDTRFIDETRLNKMVISASLPNIEKANSLEDFIDENSNNEDTAETLKIKRISDWVNDLQDFDALDAANETIPETVVKTSPEAEINKAILETITASASSSNLSNRGLTTVPFLSSFVNLKVLNLSSNSIVKIPTGSLPRGVHALNLSRNKISVVEGLRELTRLRVLDLSHNRIIRIGHGLAYCSSIKELYLAGNKISDVDGLHRLLKLTVLDLRYNKISTAKSLGQLASNYNSLTVLGLEGNPAQKNEGEEQLKKYLLGFLPNLVYLNRRATKLSAKDAARTHLNQLDRGSNKASRKSARVGTSTRPPSVGGHRHRAGAQNDGPSSGRVGLKNGLAIRRSHSEGALSAV